MHSLDIFVQHYFSTIRTVPTTEFWYVFSTLFDFSLASVIITLCITGLIHLFRGKRYAVLFLATMTVGTILSLVLKNVFNITRPDGAVMTAFGQSFPSYHALVTTILFGMLMFVFDQYFRPFWRVIFNTICILLIIAVSFSRLYLGVHWLSDVLGGIVIGVCISYIAVYIFNRK